MYICVTSTVTYTSFIPMYNGYIVCMLSLCTVDRVFEPRSGHTKDYEISICSFSGERPAQRRVGSNRDNVSEWTDISIYTWTVGPEN